MAQKYDYWLKTSDQIDKMAEQLMKTEVDRAENRNDLYSISKLFSLLVEAADKVDAEYALLQKRVGDD